ncbi:MAG TPA: hypothetical protein VGR63_18320 [Casimicrobiaceae bacterium]|nr:hypothetical protein [Casimicrobiaceae bacterium]
MKTIVYQSYRTQNVAPWLVRCMRSVADWARGQQYEYRFIDDRLFDRLPDWYRRGAGHNILVLANLARLVVARDLLDDGYDRTIWVDADILVFDDAFRIEIERDFAFCYEVWVWTEGGRTLKQAGVNNSVSVFVRDNAFLDFAIWAHEDVVRRGKHLLAHGTSTRLLSSLYKAVPFPLLTSVGMLSPDVARDVRDGDNRLAAEYAVLHARPIRAINLCASLCGEAIGGRTLDDDDYAAIVDAIVASRGAPFTASPGVPQILSAT